jgi:hypothetical protein
VMIRHILPSAINCFFHVYEERIGTYGFRVLKHVLACPAQYARLAGDLRQTCGRPVMKTGCKRAVDPHAYVTVGNDIVVDRTWCKGCAAIVNEEMLRGHAPTQRTEIYTQGAV